MTEAIGFVFARGGSKGVPGKNLRQLAGKPLLAHAIAAAKATRCISRVVVSTDDPAIAEAAREWGGEVPFLRPAELAGDQSPEWLAWQHAIRAVRAETPFDVFVSVPTTAPLRAPQDIEACVDRLGKGGVDIVVTVTPASRSPYFNMVTLAADGAAALVIPPAATVHNRQAAPPVFDMTTVCYAARADFVLAAGGIFDGRVGAVVVPRERALDIDSELDLEIAACLFAGRRS